MTPTATRRTGAARFEDLVAWQRARALAGRIYETTGTGKFARDFGLASQIQRASVSVMSNIAEGFERSHAREFHQHLAIAKGSCAEVRSHLYVALDAGYLPEETFNSLMGDANQVAKLTGGLRAAVARRL